MACEVILYLSGRKQEDMIYDLTEVVVDTTTGLPSMFNLILGDRYDLDSKSCQYSDSRQLEPGKEISISIKTDEIPEAPFPVKAKLIEGIITAIEPEFSEDGSVLVNIRGYDWSFKLTQGKKTRTFLNKTDSEIVKKIAQENGLRAEADMTRIRHEHITQLNQTDWEFIQSRARVLGYQVLVRGKKLYFKKSGSLGPRPAELEWGFNLSSFEPKLSVMGQVTKATVRGSNHMNKQPIRGVALPGMKSPFRRIGIRKSGGSTAKSAFRASPEEHIADTAVTSVQQAKKITEASLIQSESQFIRAEGMCVNGDPRLVAGTQVRISGVGKRFGGTYYLTKARHHFCRGQYTVQFSSHGNTAETLGSLLNGREASAGHGIPGVVPAIVTNINDTKKLGRVKVKYPWAPKSKNAEIESAWARVAVPGGGNNRGVYFLPEVNDEVLVAFEQGDVNSPYIVGYLWNGKDKPPKGTAEVSRAGKVNQRLIRSRSGHLIVMDDSPGKEQIVIQDKTNKNKLVFDCKKNAVTIKAAGDLIFDAGGKLVMKSRGAFSISSRSGGIKTQGALDLRSQQRATVRGGPGRMEVQAAGATLEGTRVDVKGRATVQVQGTAMVQIQGAMVKIN